MGLEVNLSQQRDIVAQPADIKSLTTLTVNRMVDSPEDCTVTVFLEELRQPIVLWEGATAYATCGASGNGQWTDADVEARLLEIYDI